MQIRGHKPDPLEAEPIRDLVAERLRQGGADELKRFQGVLVDRLVLLGLDEAAIADLLEMRGKGRSLEFTSDAARAGQEGGIEQARNRGSRPRRARGRR